MAKRDAQKKLERALLLALDTKQNKPVLVPGIMGAYVDGVQQIRVATRRDFVWVRLRGSTSEVIQAFNEMVSLTWDLPILVYRDPAAPDIWKVYGRDVRQYDNWQGASYLAPHADAHSFARRAHTGSDVVWIYKRQFMPLLPHPNATGSTSLSLYLEADYYYFGGQYHWFPGTGTAALASSKPTGAMNARYVTVYIDGPTGDLGYLDGPEFNAYLPPLDPGDYIEVPTPAEGIPICAVLLMTGTTMIGWGEIYDLRLAATPTPAVAGVSGVFVVNDEGVLLGAVSTMNFVGPGVSVSLSGTYATVVVPAYPGTMHWDDGVPIGTGTIIDWGLGLVATISGTVVLVKQILGAPNTGSIVVLEDGGIEGSTTQMDFVGAGVDVTMSGTRARVDVPLSTGIASYLLAGNPMPLTSVSGVYWRLPAYPYSTGSLMVFVDGVAQRPGIDYAEQFAESGTYSYTILPETGSIHVAIWGGRTIIV